MNIRSAMNGGDMGETPILISVVLPVYNVEEYLVKCLESLVHQTFQGVEIVAVDDGSTDGSGRLLDEYAIKYPEMMHVIHTENQGQGMARNLAVTESRGAYIAFCDGDDFFELNGLEKMYQVKEKEQCDLVYCASYRLRANNKYILGELTRPVTKGSMLLEATPFTLWSLLVDKELLVKTGDIPDMIYEDVAYIPGLISNASKVGYCGAPVYNWLDREGSTVHRIKEPKILDFITAVKIALDKVDAAYQEEILMNLSDKLVEKIKTAWYYGDKFLEYLNELKVKIEGSKIYQENPDKYKGIGAYLRMAETPYMEKIVYVNGFRGGQKAVSNREINKAEQKKDSNTQQYVTIKEAEKIAFREGTRGILLSEDSCNIYENTLVASEYDKGNLDYVGAYFALKGIYETGGIYIGTDMQINGPFDSLRCYPVFWGYMDENSFTDKVFGGKSKNTVIKAILDKYQMEPIGEPSKQARLSEYICEVLIEQEQIEMNGRTSFTKYAAALLAPQGFMTNLGGKGMNLTQCLKYPEYVDTTLIPQTMITALFNYPTTWQSSQIRNWKYKLQESRTKQNQLKQRIEELKQEKAKLKKEMDSDAYRCSLFLTKSKIGRLFIRILKKK